MAQKRPRISVGVLAVCCGVLSLSVVAREAASHSEAGASSRKYTAAVHHQPVHPGSFSAPVESVPDATGTTVYTAPFTPAPPKANDDERHRKTRETISLPRPALPSDEHFPTGTTTVASQIRRRRMEPKIRDLPEPLLFMPARGRRFRSYELPTEKRQITIEQMLEKGDYFVPNRGKKAPNNGELIKKGKFDVLLGGTSDEYFFPNRGKKQYLLAYDRKGATLPLEDTLTHYAVPSLQQLPRPLMNRWRRNLLENLANEHKDTFFSSRGKRVVPMAEEVMLVPSRSLTDDQDDETVQEGLAEGKVQDFVGPTSNDRDALFWNEDLLLPLDQAAS
uniref:Uncharacterized protein n=1 Tax=Anopheles epiroticus TaxID=199890 RepID=A0A182PQ79_9DIPT